MDKKKDSQYYFISDYGENSGYEDISSSSSRPSDSNDIYSLSSFSGKGNYRKKKHGFFAGISRWWSKRKKGQKAAIIVLTSLVLVVSILLSIFFNMFDYNYNKIDTSDLGFENVINKNIVNVALFGIDTRDEKSFDGNSDSIMILSLNTVTKKVKIISVMRDTLVPITYNGNTSYKKINSAYAKGGPELAIKTLNQIFNLDISDYATVNFFGMVDIIDAVGGIDAELTEAEVQPKSKFRFGINACISEICKQSGIKPSGYITTPGKHHLNGVQAVAYSRIRKVANIWGTTDDYGRTDRQRYVMEQLFNKAVTLEKKSYVKLAKSLIPCSQTSLTYNEIMGLAFNILLKSPKFEQMRVPQNEYVMPSPNTSAGSVVYFDLDYASKLIHAFIYDDIVPDKYIEANGVEKNDWYRDKVGSYTPYSPNSGNSNSSDNPGSTVSSHDPASSEDPITSEPQDPDISEPDDPDDPPDPDNSDPDVSDDPVSSDGSVSEPTPSEPDNSSNHTDTSH